ncbi:L,D-transpeptidase [Priestia megaterium]|uniref:L,D-transpeptidase n=1 Tax=Priestia megaterium TaxID=1404 RepID=UPI002E270797
MKIVDPVATGKKWDKTPVGFFKVVNKIKNRPLSCKCKKINHYNFSPMVTFVRY